MTPAAELCDVRKIYKRTAALDGLTLTFPAGRVVGFLGPNGAGKTTTFRVLLGLVKAAHGTARLLGEEVPDNLARVVRRVGAIVDGPALYDTLTASDNLRVARSSRQSAGNIEDTLRLVGLSERADDRVAGYSKGMRQRLALGMALLDDPDLLLLDEPMDGLDPAGQRDLRDLLGTLANDHAKTVVISSHVLADVQALADHVVVINRGKLVAAGGVDELVGADRTRLVVEDPSPAIEILAGHGLNATIDQGRIFVETNEPRRVAELLGAASIYPSELIRERRSLEQVFLEITGEGR